MAMKAGLAVILAVLISMLPAVPAYAQIERIRGVTLDIRSDIEPGEEIGEESIDIHSSQQGRYSVTGWEVMNEGFYWEDSSVPEVKITLTSLEGYKFSYIGEKNLKVQETSYEFISSKRDDEDTVCVIRLRLKPLYSKIGAVEGSKLGPDGLAQWDNMESAAYYEVILFCDGKRAGSMKTVYEEQYQFGDDITKGGYYTYRIRPVSKYDETCKGAWTESQSCQISSSMAEGFENGSHDSVSGGNETPSGQLR